MVWLEVRWSRLGLLGFLFCAMDGAGLRPHEVGAPHVFLLELRLRVRQLPGEALLMAMAREQVGNTQSFSCVDLEVALFC